MKKREIRLGLLSILFGIILYIFMPVSVYAAQSAAWHDMPTECTCTEHTSAIAHIYVTGETYAHPTLTDMQCAEGIGFASNGNIMEFYEDGDRYGLTDIPVSTFETPFARGWYYTSNMVQFYKCTSSSPAEAFDSVDIDLSCVRAGKTLMDIFSSVANSITTDPVDTIDINGIVLSHGSSDSEFLEPTDPLEEGNTYTLWLTLQSTDYLFKQDSVSDYALSNLNIDAAYKNVLHDDSFADEGTILDMEIRFTVDSSTPGPNPDPKPAPKKEPESKGMDAGYMAYLMSQIKTDDAKKKVPAKAEPDRDTFKSEAPAKTVVAADAVGAASFLDLKVHGVDEKTSVNQKFLAQNLVRPSVNILLTENIYPRRELGMAEDGAAKTLSWNNLPKDQAGPVFAVVYNQKDGAYVLNGTLDANGTAAFQGFKLRPASTITICK